MYFWWHHFVQTTPLLCTASSFNRLVVTLLSLLLLGFFCLGFCVMKLLKTIKVVLHLRLCSCLPEPDQVIVALEFLLSTLARGN